MQCNLTYNALYSSSKYIFYYIIIFACMCVHFHYFNMYTCKEHCMYVMCLTSLMDSTDDRTVAVLIL